MSVISPAFTIPEDSTIKRTNNVKNSIATIIPCLFKSSMVEDAVGTYSQANYDEYEFYNGDETLFNITKNCLRSSYYQIYDKILIYLTVCIITGIVKSLDINFYIKKSVIIFLGIYILHYYFALDCVYLLVFIFSIFSISLINHGNKWNDILFMCEAAILLCSFGQFIVLSTDTWDKIRGSLMIIIMKIISISFDQIGVGKNN
ncbi:unnamed protein product [Gordionus sp. m RMFG-2023]